jgi:hypothetical protein
VATKKRGKTEVTLGDIGREIGDLRLETRREIGELRSEMGELRSEMQAGFATLTHALITLTDRVDTLTQRMDTLAETQLETNAVVRELVIEQRQTNAELRSHHRRIIRVEERVSKLETRKKKR